jgi:hypothetical protein
LTETGRWTLRSGSVEVVRADGALAYSGAFSVLSGPKLELKTAGSIDLHPLRLREIAHRVMTGASRGGR